MAYFNPDDINDSLILLSGVGRQIYNAYNKVQICNSYLDVRIKNNLSYNLSNIHNQISANINQCNNIYINIESVLEEYSTIMGNLSSNDLFNTDFSGILERFSTLVENNSILNDISNFLIGAGSTGAMVVSSGVHGLLNLVENLVDAAVTLAVFSTSTPVAISGDYLSYLITGKEFGFMTGLETIVKDFVQTEYVNNAFEDFYTNNSIGKYINDNAIDLVKNGSTVDQFIQTGAEVAGIIGISLLTAGVGGAAAGGSAAIAGNTTGIMATTAGLSGFGKEVEEAWNNGADTWSGIGAGAISGLWDGFQWWLGGNLAGQGLKAIGADVITAGVDMPLKSLIDSSSTGKDYLETFEANGGFQSILTNMTIAGLFSGISEFKSYKVNNSIDVTTNTIDDIKGFKNNYWTDQAVLHKIKQNIDSEEYKEMKQFLIDRGLSKKETLQFMDNLNDKGACSYASVVNEMINNFKNDTDVFEKAFGYPLFKENGQVNDAKLLSDLYMYANSDINGGKLFKYENGNYSYILQDAEKQQYMSKHWLGKEDKLIDKFLKSKSDDFTYKSELLARRTDGRYDSSSGRDIWKWNFDPATGDKGLKGNFDFQTGEKILYNTDIIKSRIEEALSSNKNVSLGVYGSKELNYITVYELNGNFKQVIKDGHSMFVTGISNDGIIVSSWGKKCLIRWDEINFSNFTLTASTITKGE